MNVADYGPRVHMIVQRHSSSNKPVIETGDWEVVHGTHHRFSHGIIINEFPYRVALYILYRKLLCFLVLTHHGKGNPSLIMAWYNLVPYLTSKYCVYSATVLRT